MRLVLDTSVIVSAARSELGAARELLQRARKQEFELVLSVALLLEYEAVLTRPEHMEAIGNTTEEIETFLAALARLGTCVSLSPYQGPESPDPGDHHVLSVALHTRADGIVTYNLKHFERPAAMMGIKLYAPKAVLDLLRSDNANRN